MLPYPLSFFSRGGFLGLCVRSEFKDFSLSYFFFWGIAYHPVNARRALQTRWVYRIRRTIFIKNIRIAFAGSLRHRKARCEFRSVEFV